MEIKNKKIKQIIEFGLILFIALCFSFLFWNATVSNKKEEADANTEQIPSQSEIGVIEYEGKKYSYNHQLSNFLFIGTDTGENLVGQEAKESGKAGQADVLLLLSVNNETKESVMYQIPRNTMTEIDIYDNHGNWCDSTYTQIGEQYAVSIGGESSCWAVKKTVSELLHNIEIDNYIAMDFTAVAEINNILGGVTLTIPEDYTAIDPSYLKDSVVTLNGEQAEVYIRYLDGNQPFHNQDRMERQFQFLSSFIEKMKDVKYENLYSFMEQYVITTLDEKQIEELNTFDFTNAESKFIPGEWKAGENQDEYYVNEELERMIIEDFYLEK